MEEAAAQRATRSKVKILTEEEAAPYRAMFEKVEAQRKFLDQEQERLLAEHDGEWVGANGTDLIFAPTWQDLFTAARARGWPLETMSRRELYSVRPPRV